MLNIFGWFRDRSKAGQTATELYGSIVAQARQPTFYRDYGVVDVAEKRYEMIVLHIVLVLERLRALDGDSAEVARHLVEAFVSDLDGSIREMAIGDPKVPAHVKKAAAGLYDRDLLYRDAFRPDYAGGASDAAGEMSLPDLLNELLFDGKDAAGAGALGRYVDASRQALADGRLDDDGGQVAFADPTAFLTE